LDGLKKTGNWREIQPLTASHNPVVLYDTSRGVAGASAGTGPAAATAGAAAAGGGVASGGFVS